MTLKLFTCPGAKKEKKTLLYNRNTIFKRVKSCNGHVFRATKQCSIWAHTFHRWSKFSFYSHQHACQAHHIMIIAFSIYINARMRISAAHTINRYTKAACTWNEREPKIQNLATVAEAAALLANLWPLNFFFIFSPNFISRILKIYPSLINADTHIYIYMRIHKGDLRNAWGM